MILGPLETGGIIPPLTDEQKENLTDYANEAFLPPRTGINCSCEYCGSRGIYVSFKCVNCGASMRIPLIDNWSIND